MSIFTRIARRWRLHKIQKATSIKLTKKQRRIVLNPNYPYLYQWKSWDRGTGKTVAAIFWTMLWRNTYILRGNEREIVFLKHFAEHHNISPFLCPYGRNQDEELNFAIPDPDLMRFPSYDMLDWLLKEYNKYAIKCEEKDIWVSQIKK